MSREQSAVYSTQRDESSEQEESELCSIPGVVNEPVENRSATENTHRRLLGQWFRPHPVVTALLILLLLVLVLALGVALAVQSAAPQIPVPPATPLSLMGCPHGWVGYKGVCYYFSRDYGTWEQAQERCSQLNASLAIAEDEEAMDLLFRLCKNGVFWLGQQAESVQQGDGSSYSSQVPVLGNSQCVYLADGNKFWSDNCSNRWRYLCSKAPAPL